MKLVLMKLVVEVDGEMGTLLKKTPGGLVVGVDGEIGTLLKKTPAGLVVEGDGDIGEMGTLLKVTPRGLPFAPKHSCHRRGTINIQEKKMYVSTHLEERKVLVEE